MSSTIRMLKERMTTRDKRSGGEKIELLNLAEKFYLMEQCHHTLCNIVQEKSFFYFHDHFLAMNLFQGDVVVWKGRADVL